MRDGPRAGITRQPPWCSWFDGRRVGGELRLGSIFDQAAFGTREEALALLAFSADRGIARCAFDRVTGGSPAGHLDSRSAG